MPEGIGYNEEQDPRDVTEEIALWQSRIQTAYKKRDDLAKKKRWDELIEEYKGIWAVTDGRYDIPILPLNLIFAFVKTELPALYIRNPHIKANPRKRTSIWTAKVLEAVTNYLWHCKHMKREIKKAIVDGLLIGHAWFKVGYTGEFGTIEEADGETREFIDNEDFFGYRIPWKNIVFDEDSIDPPYDCSWICHSVWMSIDDVKKHPRFKNTEKLHISEEEVSSQHSNQAIRDLKKQKVRVDEVWDIKSKTVFTVADGAEGYLEDPKPWPYEMKGYPFSFLCFNKVNDEPYGPSDALMFEPQVLELMKLRSMELDHLKRYNRQMQADESLSDDELHKLTQGISGAIVKGDLSKGDLVKPIQYPQLQPDAYAIEERLKEDAINISGQTPQERGGTQKTTTRAVSELEMIAEGAKNRRSEKVDLVEAFVEDIARNLIGLIKQFSSTPYYVRILGTQSSELQKAIQERPSAQGEEAITNQDGFTFTKEDIEGEYDISVVSGSSTPIDRNRKLQLIIDIMKLLPQAGVTPGSPVYGTLGRMIAEEFDMPEVLQAIEQEAQRQAQLFAEQKAQQEEMKQLQMGAQGAENQIKAEREATKQTGQELDLLKSLIDAKLREKEIEAKKGKE